MADNIEVNQKAAIGSETTQIAVQNNYNGLTPAEACNLATNLFYDNFPKLQEYAMNMVEQRVTEFMDNISQRLQYYNVTNMEAFADPDVQYALLEAQKDYARFGTKERLETLANLISKRVQHNDADIVLKTAIDKAIEIAGFLTEQQLDYLSLLFTCAQVHFNNILTVEQLKIKLQILSNAFSHASESSIMYLNMLGCLQLSLTDIHEVLAESYKFNKEDVEKICPDLVSMLAGDYITSHIGTILAIIHAESKISDKFDPTKWIHD